MTMQEKRTHLANLALEIATSNAAATQMLEQQVMADYITGNLTIDQVLAKMEERITENLRRIKAARLRWARRGDPFRED